MDVSDYRHRVTHVKQIWLILYVPSHWSYLARQKTCRESWGRLRAPAYLPSSDGPSKLANWWLMPHQTVFNWTEDDVEVEAVPWRLYLPSGP